MYVYKVNTNQYWECHARKLKICRDIDCYWDESCLISVNNDNDNYYNYDNNNKNNSGTATATITTTTEDIDKWC